MGARHGKFNVRSFAFYWNAMLSLFSWCGVFAVVPVLVSSLWEHGLYFTTCAPAAWYGSRWSGFFVALFVYSKISELVDTVLLLLAGKPVIALQWWHHSTVLLYCWHSYSVRIATGAWFACMNYSVHSIMYGYFAVMGTKHRRAVAPYAIYIAAAAGTNARGHVRHDEGRAASGGGRGVPREQDELDPGPRHVRELLCALLQALRRQLLPEAEGPEAAADRPGNRALHEPQDHPDSGGGGGGGGPQRGSLVGGGAHGVGREEAELSRPRRRCFVF